MIDKIMELIQLQDNLKVFEDYPPQNNLTTLSERLKNITSLSILKKELDGHFKEIMDKNDDDSIYYYESIRMLKFIDKLFKKIEEHTSQLNGDGVDDMIDVYVESLVNYVDNVDVIKEHIEFLLS
ncbi:hypothetical protein CWI38_0086p0050 [Hamiltosporidium tvaerminnensis]|uniref:Uncharacterized protein n=2 Tax=Hamiltosporidium TaxID=1176354 RepID=A0A4Q9L1F8_9MICR|nr:hypothetical protein LUQ84_000981 [Hamiltosporidium tvaerminnensis]TBU01209.1 hypothetical protein CWI37_0775p0020 [Hamiltosporidium tvaerminnensis]TBU01834.1 hypothetical protein CWI37_0617p0020 [Hamiltosporidium tvaerminnensis]TBU08544.1 hypothetical protein CWI36_0125p0040 [Hamiltosporidium magnivora]TBU20348.1 hypothetical protein CWI38_0086p0050 [Hamiltosporidium tvaerminnensis]